MIVVDGKELTVAEIERRAAADHSANRRKAMASGRRLRRGLGRLVRSAPSGGADMLYSALASGDPYAAVRRVGDYMTNLIAAPRVGPGGQALVAALRQWLAVVLAWFTSLSVAKRLELLITVRLLVESEQAETSRFVSDRPPPSQRVVALPGAPHAPPSVIAHLAPRVTMALAA